MLFSSAAAVLGSPGQGSYAAANAFLDALAAHRRARHLAGQSLAWGLWARPSEMTGHLDSAALTRLRRAGLQPMTTAQGLALFDAAAALDAPLAVPARLDLAALSRAGTPLLRALAASAPARPAAAATRTGDGLAARLAALSPADREQEILQIVLAGTAAVLGHARPGDIDPHRAFRDMGIDSLTALELRNHLTAQTSLRLPATLAFDYPAPADLARHLRTEISADVFAEPQVFTQLAQLESILSEVPAGSEMRADITARLANRAIEMDARPGANGGRYRSPET